MHADLMRHKRLLHYEVQFVIRAVTTLLLWLQHCVLHLRRHLH